MPRKRIPEPWRSFLAELDQSVAVPVQMHCLGGFVLSVLYGLPRPTGDVDVLAIVPDTERMELLHRAGKGSVLHRKYRVFLDHVAVATVPGDYEQRLREMFPGAFRNLQLLALDPYDLALAKLERNLPRDREDVKHLARAFPLNVLLLRQRYQQELREYLGNPEREDLTLQLWIDAIEEERAPRASRE